MDGVPIGEKRSVDLLEVAPTSWKAAMGKLHDSLEGVRENVEARAGRADYMDRVLAPDSATLSGAVAC
jgi:hypothetical protein